MSLPKTKQPSKNEVASFDKIKIKAARFVGTEKTQTIQRNIGQIKHTQTDEEEVFKWQIRKVWQNEKCIVYKPQGKSIASE